MKNSENIAKIQLNKSLKNSNLEKNNRKPPEYQDNMTFQRISKNIQTK